MIYKVLSIDEVLQENREWWLSNHGRAVKEQILEYGVIEDNITKRSFNLGVSGIFLCKTPISYSHILGGTMRVLLHNVRLEPWREGICL